MSWSTADGSGLVPTDEDQSGLSAGTYDVTISDANNWSSSLSITIVENDLPTVTAMTSDTLSVRVMK